MEGGRSPSRHGYQSGGYSGIAAGGLGDSVRNRRVFDSPDDAGKHGNSLGGGAAVGGGPYRRYQRGAGPSP
jgi:hypothetical protein